MSTDHKPPELSKPLLGTIPLAAANEISEQFAGARIILKLPGGQIYIEADMDIDADGSPRAKEIDPGNGQLETSLQFPGVSGQARNVDAEKVPYPTLVSESGRALTAHHSVLIVEVIAANTRENNDEGVTPEKIDHPQVAEMAKILSSVADKSVRRKALPVLLETFHDAAEKRQEISTLFELGYLSIEQRAVAEKLYWAVCGTINRMLQKRNPELLPKDLVAMREQLIDQYLCDFSVFQSILDYWAIGQVFPIMPIQRLTEQPSRQAMLVDLTCDSDGKVDRFISPVGVKNSLEVHRLIEGESYYLGFFLMGAYQDILGDIHNLFGRVTEVHVYADAEEPDNYFIEKVIKGTTVQEILAVVQYFPNDLQRRMEQLIQQKVKDGLIRPKIGVQLLDQYSKAFHEYTYLGPDS